MSNTCPFCFPTSGNDGGPFWGGGPEMFDSLLHIHNKEHVETFAPQKFDLDRFISGAEQVRKILDRGQSNSFETGYLEGLKKAMEEVQKAKRNYASGPNALSPVEDIEFSLEAEIKELEK